MAPVSNDTSTSDSTSYLRSRRDSLASSAFYYSQDRVHLVRIAVVTTMGFLTLLVVTLLLHEAVLADQRIVNSPYKHQLIDKHKVEKAIRGMSTSETKMSLPFRTNQAPEEKTTEMPQPLPPTQMRYAMSDPEHFKKWRDGYRKRRKPYKRNSSSSGPYRLNLLPKDSYDPYMFGEDEYKRPNTDRKYSYPTDAKSIQEIIHFLTESKHRGRLAQHGLRFKGKVKNLDMNDPVNDMFPQEDRHEQKLASSNPLEDFRMAGDPKEVNNVLMGYTPNRQKTAASDVKPKTVSLMLDIHPMGGHAEEAAASSPTRSRPRRPPRKKFRGRNRPQQQDDSHYRDRERDRDRDYYRHREEMLHARPSYNQESSRPYHKGDRDTSGPDTGKHHQIMLHLNFFPTNKKKQNDVDLNPSASRPAAISDLAPSPRDVDLRQNKGDNASFKSEPIPSILNDPSINVFNRHRYGSSTATVNKGPPVPNSQVHDFEDFSHSLFQEVKNHRLTPVDVAEPVPQPHQDAGASVLENSSHLYHPTYPLGGLTYGLPVHRFIGDTSLDEIAEPRDNTLKV